MSESYPKIWTSIRHDLWVKSLRLSGRGVFLQLIVIAKDTGDTGLISWRSWTGCGDDLGCDGKTARKILGKFREDGKITLEVLNNKMIVLNLLNYLDYQKLTRGEQVRNKARKIPQNGENSPLNKDKIKGNELVEEQKPNYNPDTIIKVHKIEYDKSKKPIENLMAWNDSEECDKMIETLSATPGYEIEWVKHEWNHKFVPEVSIKDEWAFDSLFNNHNGSWRDFFWSWLKRAKRYGNHTTFYQGRVT